MHQTMLDFLRALEREGRASTGATYEVGLQNYAGWLAAQDLDPLKATLQNLQEFQRYLAEDYRSPERKSLARATQGTRLAAMKSYYLWLYRRGLIVVNPAWKVKPPTVRRNGPVRDHLTQQEATAIIQTQAKIVGEKKKRSKRWAVEVRNLAILCLAIATGRRRMSLMTLKVEHLDFERREIRVEWEKGKVGRVLPCVGWAMTPAKNYIEQARSIILAGRPDPHWLFVGEHKPRLFACYVGRLLKSVQRRTAEENPDLEGLADKKLTAHSLRTTFATMLFLNGANIRFVNELLLHERLSTTAVYTPLELDDLRRALRTAHPRA